MDKEYIEILRKQYLNLDIPSIKAYFEYLYEFVESNFGANQEILEIGSGLGGSAKFLKLRSVTRTDLLEIRDSEVVGAVDAHNLPFADNSFDGAFAVDALHHMENPFKVLDELIRVINKGNKIIVIEPYVSMFSYPIYKFFHSEEVSMRIRPDEIIGKVNKNAGAGNQTLLQSMLKVEDFYRDGQIRLLERRLISPFSFFATGGINHPLPIGRSTINIILTIEKLIPKQLMKVIAARQVLVLEKI